MFKSSTVFLCLLATSMAMQMGTDYSETLNDIFRAESGSPTCKREAARFKECFKDIEEDASQYKNSSAFPSKAEILAELPKVRAALKCVGEVTCHKSILGKYIVEGSVYALEKFFTGGYACLNEENLKNSMMRCMIFNTPIEDLQTSNAAAIAKHMKPIARCVALDQKCGDQEKREFLKGAMALGEMTEVAVQMALGVQNGDKSYIEKFDKKFNPRDFDGLTL